MNNTLVFQVTGTAYSSRAQGFTLVFWVTGTAYYSRAQGFTLVFWVGFMLLIFLVVYVLLLFLCSFFVFFTMLPVSLDCPSLIVPLVFSNVYFPILIIYYSRL